MYIYTPLCRYWIALYRYVLVFIVPHVDIELEDNKQFISNIPRRLLKQIIDTAQWTMDIEWLQWLTEHFMLRWAKNAIKNSLVIF